MDTYAHIFPAVRREAANMIDVSLGYKAVGG
jgi:hypothetical protein